MGNMTTQSTTCEAIDTIVQISRRIDDLAEKQDWLTMNEWVEQRRQKLSDLFDFVCLRGADSISEQDWEKLRDVANANRRILQDAKHRRGAVAKQALVRLVLGKVAKAYAMLRAR